MLVNRRRLSRCASVARLRGFFEPALNGTGHRGRIIS
jgi:hypothetical protein